MEIHPILGLSSHKPTRVCFSIMVCMVSFFYILPLVVVAVEIVFPYSAGHASVSLTKFLPRERRGELSVIAGSC